MAATRFRSVALILALLAGASCGKDNEKSNPPQDVAPQFSLWQDDQEKGRWIDRVSRKLRHGKEISADEAFLMGRSAEEIITYMMNDPDFALSVLDFNLHFLGFRSEKLKMPNGGAESAFNGDLFPDYYSTYTSAVESAQNVVKNGDFLAILDFGTNPYFPPLASGKFSFGAFQFDVDENRKMLLARQSEKLTMLETMARNQPRRTAFCKIRQELTESAPFDGSTLYSIWQWAFRPLQQSCTFSSGGSDGSSDDSDAGDEGDESDQISREDPALPPGEQPPADNDADPILPDSIIADIAETKRRIMMVRKLNEELHKDNYLPKSVADLRTLDLTPYEITPQQSKVRAQRWFWGHFRNSSTNMNRKRAAYVLKRYFCDDLTPIGIEAPEVHANGDRHGTDPGCQSCHYKLDPMAGFFRNLGIGGNDFSTSDTIVFDDFASKPRAEYIKQWRNADDTSWNVGYIRSVTNPELNDLPKGDPGISELLATIKNAPEVKQCIVKNLFAYLVGEGVSIDRGYLTELSQDFTERANVNSTEALKHSIQKILTSSSFVQESPEKGVCYDYPTGYVADGKPPCEVAHVLTNSCEQCHSATNNQGGLDVSTWAKQKGFAHLNVDGTEVPFRESLRRIDERLTSPDIKKRMPLNKHMSSFDRDLLYKWVKAELEKP